jgi:hypothetical protein
MYSSYSFTTSALDGGEWSASQLHFTPWKRIPGTQWIGGWVSARAGLDTEVRGKILLPLPGIEPRLPGRPVHSQTLLTELPWLPSLLNHTIFQLNFEIKSVHLSCLCNRMSDLSTAQYRVSRCGEESPQ